MSTWVEKNGKYEETKEIVIQHTTEEAYVLRKALLNRKNLLISLQSLHLDFESLRALEEIGDRVGKGQAIADQLVQTETEIATMPDIPMPEPKDTKVPK